MFLPPRLESELRTHLPMHCLEIVSAASHSCQSVSCNQHATLFLCRHGHVRLPTDLLPLNEPPASACGLSEIKCLLYSTFILSHYG